MGLFDFSYAVKFMITHIFCFLAKYELPRSDIITYSALIKSAKLPPIVRNKHDVGKKKLLYFAIFKLLILTP